MSISWPSSGTQGLRFASTEGYVVREAKRRGLGQEIPTSWFLQDIGADGLGSGGKKCGTVVYVCCFC